MSAPALSYRLAKWLVVAILISGIECPVMAEVNVSGVRNIRTPGPFEVDTIFCTSTGCYRCKNVVVFNPSPDVNSSQQRKGRPYPIDLNVQFCAVNFYSGTYIQQRCLVVTVNILKMSLFWRIASAKKSPIAAITTISCGRLPCVVPFGSDLPYPNVAVGSLYKIGAKTGQSDIGPQFPLSSVLGDVNRSISVTSMSVGTSPKTSGGEPQTNGRSGQNQVGDIDERYVKKPLTIGALIIGACAFFIGLFGTLILCRNDFKVGVKRVKHRSDQCDDQGRR